jgi:hypothetical protein
MSQKLHTAVTDILAMPYFKNEHARSGGANYGHEEAVSLRVKDAGFTEVDKINYPKLTKSLLKKWARTGDDTDLREATKGLPVGSYILQPAGSQGFPDILILDFNNIFVSLECKSGKTGLSPMWNDSLPNPNTIYILSSGIRNETTIFMGRDVITEEELDCRENFLLDIKALIDKYKELMPKLDVFERGWLLKARQQYFQEGGGTKTNYFIHPKRRACELLALEYARQ